MTGHARGTYLLKSLNVNWQSAAAGDCHLCEHPRFRGKHMNGSLLIILNLSPTRYRLKCTT